MSAAIITIMRRWILLLAVIIMACRAFTPSGTLQPSLRAGGVETPASTVTTLAASPTPLPGESPLLPGGVTPTPGLPSDLDYQQEISYTVILHPDGALYVGDWVSLELIAPEKADVEGRSVEIQIDPPNGETIAAVKFGGYGIANRTQATLPWAWNTAGLPAGEHTLSFSILPEGTTWTETVILLPQSDIPFPETHAGWAAARSECCLLYYITGTDAERDLPSLLEEADRQAVDVEDRFGIDYNETITITLIPRVLGHGGFANSEINISYLDGNYAGSQFGLVLHHEIVHIIDGRLGGELRPTMLVEGLAVYLTGGHFKPEPLLPRAAALLELPSRGPEGDHGWYLPLQPLADNFYPAQHEIGYLQAGALIEYMVKTWGWEAFSSFYRDIHPYPSKSQTRAIDQALQKHFKITFADLERDYLEELQRQEVRPEDLEDVRLTVAFYDAVRRYQQILDPSAYFQTAWLVDNQQMRQRGIVADYLRHPSAPVNIALETLFVTASEHLRVGEYAEAEKILTAINDVLDKAEGEPSGEGIREGQ